MGVRNLARLSMEIVGRDLAEKWIKGVGSLNFMLHVPFMSEIIIKISYQVYFSIFSCLKVISLLLGLSNMSHVQESSLVYRKQHFWKKKSLVDFQLFWLLRKRAIFFLVPHKVDCHFKLVSLLTKETSAQCLKIAPKVAYNIASEASYVLKSGQKFIKNAKNGQFGKFLKTWNFWSNSVTRQATFNGTKIDGKCYFSLKFNLIFEPIQVIFDLKLRPNSWLLEF